MSGDYKRCPSCGFGRPLRVTIESGDQREMCTKCHGPFRLIIRNWKIVDVERELTVQELKELPYQMREWVETGRGESSE